MTYEEAIKKIKQFGLYHAIGDLPNSVFTVQAFKLAIEALEKQIPKKPVLENRYIGHYNCPICNEDCTYDTVFKYPYCPFCGQAIDWSDI